MPFRFFSHNSSKTGKIPPVFFKYFNRKYCIFPILQEKYFQIFVKTHNLPKEVCAVSFPYPIPADIETSCKSAYTMIKPDHLSYR